MKLLKKKYLYAVSIKSESGHESIHDPDANVIVSVEFKLPFYKAHHLYNNLRDLWKESW